MPRLPRKYNVLLVGGALAGVAALWCRRRWGATGGAATTPLTADAFNALQSKALLGEALAPDHLPWAAPTKRKGSGQPQSRAFALTLYRLMGCPFCARVEWILRFYGVPFDTVDVDTLSGKGIPDSRYTSVPQIKLASVADNHSISPDSLALDGDSVYVVDSQCIISALAAPLQFGGQLKDARVSKTRQWIVNRFQTVSFLATSSQWTNAYVTHPLVTPARYHNAVFRVVGASAVYLLARWEIAPAFVKRCSESGGDVGTLRELLRKDPCALLEEELVTFTSNLQGTSARRFHGGDKPDIADVEMFAVTRIIEAHPVLRDVLHKGVLGGWSAAMEREMQERVRT